MPLALKTAEKNIVPRSLLLNSLWNIVLSAFIFVFYDDAHLFLCDLSSIVKSKRLGKWMFLCC